MTAWLRACFLGESGLASTAEKPKHCLDHGIKMRAEAAVVSEAFQQDQGEDEVGSELC